MNDRVRAFEDFLTKETAKIFVGEFVVNLIITLLLAYLLSWVYTRYGQSLSNRRRFGSNFPVLAMTTMLIITVVKSSLALSLGLVGALSIVRFRAAIKEPEELAFLFITIALGLGMGAGQTLITVIGFGLILVAILGRYFLVSRPDENKNIFLTISATGGNRFELPRVSEILRQHCTSVDLKRFDQTEDSAEALFIVEIADFDDFERTRAGLAELDRALNLTFLDQSVV